MSINQVAIATRVDQLVNQALAAIENRSHTPSWFQTVNSVGDQLSRLRNQISGAKQNVQHFASFQQSAASPQFRHRINQSARSRTDNLNKLDATVSKAMMKIAHKIKATMKLGTPFADQSAMELLDGLAGELENFDTLLKKAESLSQQVAMRAEVSQTQPAMMRGDIAMLKQAPVSGPSTLMLLAIVLRVLGMWLQARQVSSS